MSVTFFPALVDGASVRQLLHCACEHTRPDPSSEFGATVQCAACIAQLNVNNRNARDLLEYLGLEVKSPGLVSARKLRNLCEARLEMPDVEQSIPAVQRGRVFNGARDASYLRERCRDLHILAVLAGSLYIAWG